MTKILVLGDGDFSFSVDLATWLAVHKPTLKNLATSGNVDDTEFHLVATGFDSYDELRRKYKDADFLLEKLRQCATPTQRRQRNLPNKLHVTIHHGINALGPHNAIAPRAFDCVMFHHPHLGTEDAQLHSYFLRHLLHSMSTVWLDRQQDRSCIYLTLAYGQWERWRGAAAAEQCKLRVAFRGNFQAPVSSTRPSYYQNRRHQSGQSFGRRAAGPSETFVLCFAGAFPGDGRHSAQTRGPFWFSVDNIGAPHTDRCSICGRSFAENRSLKNHLRDKHAVQNSGRSDLLTAQLEGTRKRRRGSDPKHVCETCDREFETASAMRDHVIAMHLSSSAQTQNTVRQGEEKMEDSFVDADRTERCLVCGLMYDGDYANHIRFLSPVTDKRDATPQVCSACRKVFCDKRARQQHENVCKLR